MTSEEKQLLLRDLCARLPYGVKMRYKGDSGYEVLCQIDTFYRNIDGFRCLLRTSGPYWGFQDLNELKPYLRPMSSMTEEEKEVVNNLIYNKESIWTSPIPVWVINESDVEEYMDFCNSHHLDWRGLIDKDLALEAPEDMYNEKQ